MYAIRSYYVLMVFVAMKYTSVDANIVALSGIAIAIGTMVDMGIILTENVLKHMDEAAPGEALIEIIGVITSYSIHYTKLYEAPPARRVPAAAACGAHVHIRPVGSRITSYNVCYTKLLRDRA